MPVLNESAQLADALRCLRDQLPDAELIVVDGGSADSSRDIAAAHADQLLSAPRCRATQMNAGAAHASGDFLLFLHADCRLASATALTPAALQSLSWGFFAVRLSGRGCLLRVVEWGMNLRSRCTRVATGDQGLLIARPMFESLGGFAEQPLMEDVEFSKRLRRVSAPRLLPEKLWVSSRRWEQRGVLRTVLLMWWLRFAYVLGVTPQRLHRWYYGAPQ